jgi:histidine triad (HIT) family protein
VAGPVQADCLFCSIVAGETPAVIVLDTPDVLAFLDHRPLFPGHTLVVPRRHVDTLRDLDDATRDVLFAEVQRVAAAVQDAMGAQGSFVAMNNVVSQSVPHLHVHAVPRNRKDGLRGFFWPRTTYTDDAEAQAVGERIRDVLVATEESM